MIGWRGMGAVILAALVVSGCTYSDALRHDSIRSVWTHGGIESRPVAFVTDRQQDAQSELGFGNHWGETVACGRAAVSVPEASPPGDPASAADAAKLQPVPCGSDFAPFIAEVKEDDSARSCESVLLYVHGYNTTFRSALLRAGQIAADAQWPCAMAAFSWGSEAKFDRYVADIERSGYSVPVLMALLTALEKAGLKTNIIAHSMGARATLSALAALGPACAAHKPINELILAAPDVNAERFNDDFGALLTRAAPCVRRITVYASRNDMVLMLAESVHGGIPRAGLEPEHDMQYEKLAPNIDVVDATDAPGDPFGHGYFVEAYEMLNDMMWVLSGADLARRSRPDAATLTCATTVDNVCEGDRYKLAVARQRRPDWTTRLSRNLLAELLAVQ